MRRQSIPSVLPAIFGNRADSNGLRYEHWQATTFEKSDDALTTWLEQSGVDLEIMEEIECKYGIIADRSSGDAALKVRVAANQRTARPR